jgi:hypothetical protein
MRQQRRRRIQIIPLTESRICPGNGSLLLFNRIAPCQYLISDFRSSKGHFEPLNTIDKATLVTA